MIEGRCRAGLPLLLTLAFLSGAAGLGYEVVWTRMLSLSLGHEITATLAVLMGFFGGIALGGFALGGRVVRSSRPQRWLAVFELCIGAWAAVQTLLLPRLDALMAGLLGPDSAPLTHAAANFAVTFLVLLPATFAMGSTLPALAALLTRALGGGRAIGVAYAANTLGAVAGTLVASLVIAPALGFTATLWTLAAINLACAAAAWFAPGPSSAPATNPVEDAGAARIGGQRLWATLFVSGALGIGYEVLGVRVLSQLLEDTAFTFAILLAVYLLGTAFGAALHARLVRRHGQGTLDRLLAVTALACVGGAMALYGAETLLGSLRGVLPSTVAGGVAAEAALGAAVFLLPTVAMGALFSELGLHAAARRGGLGRAVAWNTLGGASAPVLFGVVLLPRAGAAAALAIICLGYAALTRPARRPVGALALAAALALAVFQPVPLAFTQVPPGGALVVRTDGVMAAVSVVQDAAGERHLQVNNHFRMGGTASVRSDRRQANIPLLLHPAPRRALFLGLGTGATLAAAADFPGLQSDGVELVPEVVDVLGQFSRANGDVARMPALHLHVADARRFVRGAAAPYDVIVADLYHPALDGSAALYTREHFAAIRERLAPGGLFCQWLPLHQLDGATLRTILRTYLAVFPRASAWLAQFSLTTPLLALCGGDTDRRYPGGWVGAHSSDPRLASALRAAGLGDDVALFGLFVAGAAELARLAGDGPLNTDDRPVVAFEAPRTVYAPQPTPAARLMALLGALHPEPGQILQDGNEIADRLAAYWTARDRFIVLGAAMSPMLTPRAMLDRTVPELLAIVRLSPDFEGAYAPLLAMARSLAGSDPEGARDLLVSIDRANPGRAEARSLLNALARR